MPLQPFFTYFGGKWRVAPQYSEPTRRTLIEPFAGAAGYSLRYPHLRVILVEKDPVVFGVWDYLTKVSSKEVMALPLLNPDGSVDDLDIPQEAKWLIGFWLNKGSSGPCRIPSKWMREWLEDPPDGSAAWWGEGVRLRIASQLSQIRHWEIIHGSYEEAPDIEATWFIDPPYQKAGAHYKQPSKNIDYQALGAWCQSREGQVIVCENEGADWLPFQPWKTIKATPGAYRSAESVEVVWTKGDGLFEGLFT